MGDLLGEGIFITNGAQWHRQRKTAAHLFKRAELEGFMTRSMTFLLLGYDRFLSSLLYVLKYLVVVTVVLLSFFSTLPRHHHTNLLRSSVFVKHGKEVIGILDGHASANTEVDIAVRYTGVSLTSLKPYIPEPFLSIYSRLNRHDSVWRRIRSVYCSPPPHDLAYYSSETLKHGSNDFTACFDKCQLLIVQRAFTPLMYIPYVIFCCSTR